MSVQEAFLNRTSSGPRRSPGLRFPAILAVLLLLMGAARMGLAVPPSPHLPSPQPRTVGFALVPVGGVGNEITVSPGTRVELEVRVLGWDLDLNGAPELKLWQVHILASGYSSGTGGPLSPPVDVVCTTDAECEAAFDTGSKCGLVLGTFNRCQPLFADITRPDWVMDPEETIFAAATNSPDFDCGAIERNAPFAQDDGTDKYGATLLVDVPITAEGDYTIEFGTNPVETFMTDEDSRLITIESLIPAIIHVSNEPGRCCFNIGLGTTQCIDDVTGGQCAAQTPPFQFAVGQTCASGCPDCGENAQCVDPIEGVTADNLCTQNVCNNGACLNPPIAAWDGGATECCDPTTAIIESRDVGDSCTTGVCTLNDAAGLGSVTQTISPGGTPCVDDNPCTFSDTCDGVNSEADGGCVGTDIDGLTCTSNPDCDSLIGGVTCDIASGFCDCADTGEPTIRFKWLPAQAGAYPPGTAGVDTPNLTITGAGPSGQPLWLGVFLSGWGSQGDLRVWQAFLDSSTLPAGLSIYRPSCTDDLDCEALMGTGLGDGCDLPPISNDTCAPAFQDDTRSDFESFEIQACAIFSDNLGCGATIDEAVENPHPDRGTQRYGATFILSADQSLAGGPHIIEFDLSQNQTFMVDETSRLIPIRILPATLTVQEAGIVSDPLQSAPNPFGIPGGSDVNRAGGFAMPASAVAGGQEVAIRVKLRRLYIDKDEDPVNGCPVGPDFSPFENQVRYVGPPSAFDDNDIESTPQFVAAELQCTPFYRDWSPAALAAEFGAGVDTSTIYYYGAEVVPCSIYEAQQATQACVESASEDCFSTALEIRTALWGDVWPSAGSFGQVNFTDVGKVVDAFKRIAFVEGDPPNGAPRKVQAMLRDNVPPLDSAINFTDIGNAVDAFKIIAYEEDGPTACP